MPATPSVSSATPLNRARRIASIEVSEIMRIGARATALMRQGRDVIVLGAGEPDFDTPEHIKAEAVEAINRGETKYTLLDGSMALKTAIAAKFKRDNELEFGPDQITAGAGAKQIIHNALMATLNDGDEVIVVTPYWMSYADMITIAGGRTVEVKGLEENGFLLDPTDLEAAITPKTRWLILNSPSNPSGAAYDASRLRAIAEVLVRHSHVWLLSDDIYEHLLYNDREFVTMAQVEPRLADRTLTVNGLSKAYAMTGWRIGYGAGPQDLIAAMAVVQSQSTSNPCSITQAAAIAALNGPQMVLKERASAFVHRRDLLVDGLNAISGIRCRVPDGAFYTFANCAGVLGKFTRQGKCLMTDTDFCDYLLDEHGVAVVPGRLFGLSPYFRISYATSETLLATAITRIAEAVKQLR